MYVTARLIVDIILDGLDVITVLLLKSSTMAKHE